MEVYSFAPFLSYPLIQGPKSPRSGFRHSRRYRYCGLESRLKSGQTTPGMRKGKEMPRHYVAALKVSFGWWLKIVDGLRSAEDAAKNVSPTIVVVSVAPVSISRVLLVALVIALHK